MPENPNVVVTNGSAAEADEFMKREWPKHDAHLGIRWDEKRFSLRAEINEECVGIANFFVVGGLGELKQLLVAEPYARAGIGSALLRNVENRCRELGCHKIRLETAEYQARPFYERHGFAVACTLKKDRFRHDWYIMEKLIAP